jgi:hypothetical protein
VRHECRAQIRGSNVGRGEQAGLERPLAHEADAGANANAGMRVRTMPLHVFNTPDPSSAPPALQCILAGTAPAPGTAHAPPGPVMQQTKYTV